VRQFQQQDGKYGAFLAGAEVVALAVGPQLRFS
jgi:hypothetical protein